MPAAAASAAIASVAMPRAKTFWKWGHKKNVQIRLIKKINFPVEYQIASEASAGRVKNAFMREDKRNNDERKNSRFRAQKASIHDAFLGFIWITKQKALGFQWFKHAEGASLGLMCESTKKSG